MTSMLQRFILAATLALLAGCSTLVPVPDSAPATPASAQSAWSRVLARFVDERGEVDFAALARERADLDHYVRYVAQTPLASFVDHADRLAHMINAYNALSMFNVVEAGIPQTHAGLNKVGFFIGRKLVVGQQPMSLYSFENEVIRPFTRKLGDPRVHFALNCLAVSCPVLPRQPFSAATLDAELERETRAFFARPQNWRVDHASASVWLNEILSFYTEDFVPVPATSLIEYANRYASTTAPAHYSVRFAPYDWTVANSRRVR